MLNAITNFKKEVSDFVFRGLFNCDCELENFSTIGVTDEKNGLIGGIVFHNYEPMFSRIELTIFSISPRWLSKRIIAVLADYVFKQLKCDVAYFRLDSNNRKAIRVLKHLGASLHEIENLRGLNRNETIGILTLKDLEMKGIV